MSGKAFLGQFFIFRPGNAVIGIWVDADATTRGKQPCHFDIFGIHQFNQVFTQSS